MQLTSPTINLQPNKATTTQKTKPSLDQILLGIPSPPINSNPFLPHNIYGPNWKGKVSSLTSFPRILLLSSCLFSRSL